MLQAKKEALDKLLQTGKSSNCPPNQLTTLCDGGGDLPLPFSVPDWAKRGTQESIGLPQAWPTSSDTAKPRTRVSFGQDQIRLYDASQPTQQLAQMARACSASGLREEATFQMDAELCSFLQAVVCRTLAHDAFKRLGHRIFCET